MKVRKTIHLITLMSFVSSHFAWANSGIGSAVNVVKMAGIEDASCQEADTICDQFFDAVAKTDPPQEGDTPLMSAALLFRTCGPPPGSPMDPQSQVKYMNDSKKGGALEKQVYTHKNTGDSKYDACANGLIEKWSQMGPHCMANKLIREASTYNQVTTGLYTAASATCLASCFAVIPPAGCQIAGGVAGLSDILGTVMLRKDGGEYGPGWTWMAGLATEVVGLGWAFAQHQAGKAAERKVASTNNGNQTPTGDSSAPKVEISQQGTNTQQPMQEKWAGKSMDADGNIIDHSVRDGNLTANQKVEAPAAPKAPEAAPAPKDPGKGNQPAANNDSKMDAASCVTGLLFGGIAIAKWDSGMKNHKALSEGCQNIKTLGGYSNAFQMSLPDPSKNKGPNDSMQTSSNGGSPTAGTPSSGGTAAGTPTDLTPEASADPMNFAQNLEAVSGKDPLMGPLSRNMPNKAQIPNDLAKLGTNLKSISDSANANGPASTLGSMGFSSDGQRLISEMDRITKEHLSQLGVAGSNYSGGGGRGSRGNASADMNPFGFFGAKTPGGLDSGMTSFDKKKVGDLYGDSDIWHSSFGGSIFQIVSGKINKTRDRIEALEWATPLNRALAGLPAKPTQKTKSGGK